MKINWIFLPDKLDSYLDLSLKKLKKTKKQMKNLKKKRSVKNKNSLDIYTSYSIPETLKILKYFKLKYNKLIQIPKKYKSKKLIEEFLRKHRITNSTTVFTKFSFFEQRGGNKSDLLREMTKLGRQESIGTSNATINLNNTINEGTNISSKKLSIIDEINKYSEELERTDTETEYIETTLVMEKKKKLLEYLIINDDKFLINNKKITENLKKIKKINDTSKDTHLEIYYKYLGEKINEFVRNNTSQVRLTEIFNDNNSSENYVKGIKAIANYLIKQISSKINNLSNDKKQINISINEFVNLLEIINDITCTTGTTDVNNQSLEEGKCILQSLSDLPKDYEALERLILTKRNYNKKKDTLKQKIEELENKLKEIEAESNKKKNNKKSKRTTRSLNEARAKRNTCLQSIQRMWFNVYDKPSLEGTVNKFDNINDNRRYQTQNQKILDFYNILHNCKPFKETLVAGVLIASPQSRENYEITTPPVPILNKFLS